MAKGYRQFIWCDGNANGERLVSGGRFGIMTNGKWQPLVISTLASPSLVGKLY
jgi:hypothetical protein